MEPFRSPPGRPRASTPARTPFRRPTTEVQSLPEAHVTRAILLCDLQRIPEALDSAERAIALRPEHADAHNARGVALTELGCLEAAIESFGRAIELKQNYAEAHANRGIAERARGNLNAAIAGARRAVELQPDYAEGAFSESLFRLLAGDYAGGWPLYEARKRRGKRSGDRTFPQPLWSGTEELRGKVLFLHWEQGLGDTIQFCRYALLAQQRGAEVILSVQRPLRALVRQLSASIPVLVDGEAPAEFDLHCPLMSLPLAFGTRVETIPAHGPYLQAEPERVALWRERIGTHGLRVGISWQGSTGTVDAGRSFAVEHFAALADVPGIRLISLQKNHGTEQLSSLPRGLAIESPGADFDNGPDAFLDTAALMANLDLVITSDTAIAHLAGALGCPSWVALKQVPDWRWLMERTDSPWYPNQRLFRQRSIGDWDGVFAAMREALAETPANNVPRSTPVPRQAPAEVHALRERALQAHHSGHLAAAERQYLELLLHVADDFDALHMLGVLCAQSGRTDEALAWLERALGKRPQSAAVRVSWGTLQLRLGHAAQALASFDAALAQRSDDGHAHGQRGIALAALARRDEALASFDAALALTPSNVEIYSNRSAVLRELGRFEEALASADHAIELDPSHAAAHANSAAVLLDLQRTEECLVSLARSLALKPDQPAALNTRGAALLRHADFESALQSFDAALALQPAFPEAHCNRAAALFELAQPQAAIEACQQALCLAPDYADGRLAQGMFHLQRGDYAEGWPAYEWRTKTARRTGERELNSRRWRGEDDLQGRSLLIHAEQGLGDTIQFCRYAHLAQQQGARVVLLVPGPLVALLRTLAPTIEVLADGSGPVPACDFHCPMLSLPYAFRTTLESIPSQVPYLSAQPERIARWRASTGLQGLRVGVAWQTSAAGGLQDRSFPIELLAPLAGLPGVRLISLQKGAGAADHAGRAVELGIELLSADFDAGPDAFVDTAAVMTSLDLVISCDTAVAHLAGALGRPTWIGLKHVADWRWLLQRTDSPWYPSLRLFRQPRRGDWGSVLAAMKRELERITN